MDMEPHTPHEETSVVVGNRMLINMDAKLEAPIFQGRGSKPSSGTEGSLLVVSGEIGASVGLVNNVGVEWAGRPPSLASFRPRLS